MHKISSDKNAPIFFNLDYSRVEVAADEEKQKIVNGKWLKPVNSKW